MKSKWLKWLLWVVGILALIIAGAFLAFTVFMNKSKPIINGEKIVTVLEDDFAFENRLYKFVDMETGNEVKVHANNIREFYQNSIHDYFQEIKVKCGQYQIDIIPADITKGFDQILYPYLLKRSHMK